MMDLSWLAATGASAIISAMASPTWGWTRSRLVRLFSPQDLGRQEAEGARLSGLAAELETTSERDVQNRLRGFLEARLSDDPDLMNEFAVVIKEICAKINLQPPTEWTSYVNAPGSVVVLAGQSADVHVGQDHHRAAHITWSTLTSHEAAQKLETLDRSEAVMELAGMDPTSAAWRLAYVEKTRAADLLSHMDERLAADLLTRISAPHNAELLASMEPSQGAAVLETLDPDWVVARLSEIEPDRAVVLFSALGSKRIADLLAAMEGQQAVQLLGAVGKVMADQARLRTTVDMTEQIVAQAQAKAESILERAQREADEMKAAAERSMAEAQSDDSTAPADVDQQKLIARIYSILAEEPKKMFSARTVASKAGVRLADAKPALTLLEAAGKIAHHHRGHLYYARPGTDADSAT